MKFLVFLASLLFYVLVWALEFQHPEDEYDQTQLAFISEVSLIPYINTPQDLNISDERLRTLQLPRFTFIYIKHAFLEFGQPRFILLSILVNHRSDQLAPIALLMNAPVYSQDRNSLRIGDTDFIQHREQILDEFRTLMRNNSFSLNSVARFHAAAQYINGNTRAELNQPDIRAALVIYNVESIYVESMNRFRNKARELRREADDLLFIARESTQSLDFSVKFAGPNYYLYNGYIYESRDLGNYLWGRALRELGISYASVVLGSEINGIFGTNSQNGRGRDYIFMGDSNSDQRAIARGYYRDR